ncbi:hypothetical protein R1flu_001314 [Riccia fluitans]|uniref:Uncharacterized protein n=1 Tax=Riccia fluitans TaxID=41844 RepID=A0ABD1Y6Y0_9MARC
MPEAIVSRSACFASSHKQLYTFQVYLQVVTLNSGADLEKRGPDVVKSSSYRNDIPVLRRLSLPLSAVVFLAHLLRTRHLLKQVAPNLRTDKVSRLEGESSKAQKSNDGGIRSLRWNLNFNMSKFRKVVTILIHLERRDLMIVNLYF